MERELKMQDRRVALQFSLPQSWLERDGYQSRQMREAEDEIALLNTSLDEVSDELSWMKHSLSWRLTLPLRVARDAARALRFRLAAAFGKRGSRR